MRINRYVAAATGLSRRKVDELIKDGAVQLNGKAAILGADVKNTDLITLNGKKLEISKRITIILNKPVGYVVSRKGQGTPTIYELLPKELHSLKPVGRLDKDSSGLLLLTNDGVLANKLTHPSYRKKKIYQVTLNKDLQNKDHGQIESGVNLEDGNSKLALEGSARNWTVTMNEGRNRQIRRTFEALGYSVTELRRIKFGPYEIGGIKEGEYLKNN